MPGSERPLKLLGQLREKLLAIDMREVRTELEINAAIDRVWRALVDFESYRDWNPFIQRASGNPVVGEKLEIYLKPPGGIGISLNPTVLVSDPGREFRWKGKLAVSGLFDGEHIFELQPTSRGCNFIHRERFTGILVAPMLAIFGSGTRQGFADMNAALKIRAESGY